MIPLEIISEEGLTGATLYKKTNGRWFIKYSSGGYGFESLGALEKYPWTSRICWLGFLIFILQKTKAEPTLTLPSIIFLPSNFLPRNVVFTFLFNPIIVQMEIDKIICNSLAYLESNALHDFTAFYTAPKPSNLLRQMRKKIIFITSLWVLTSFPFLIDWFHKK